MEWVTEGFEGFSRGSFENGGQNLYVSRKGVLQRIFQYDVNGDGRPDLLFACSQSMYERPPVHVYPDFMRDKTPVALPSGGTYDGVLADLHGSGYDDLVIACQGNGTHSDITSYIFFGGAEGFSENDRMELPAPNATGVCAGDFNGDGKQELVFISNGKLRMFFQREAGFGPSDFVDYPVEAEFIAAADLDGDGCCDLYLKTQAGRAGILFGGRDGFADEVVWLDLDAARSGAAENSTTAGMSATKTNWRPCVVRLSGKTLLFGVEAGTVCLFACGADRALTRALSLPCPGAVAAAAADLTGDGSDDLAVAVFEDRDREADCRIYPGSGGLRADRWAAVPVAGAVNVTVARLDGPKVIFCRAGERVRQEVPCPVVRLLPDGRAEKVDSVTGGDCNRILAGPSPKRPDTDQLVILNHMMARKQGHENVYVYLGGEDGYAPERKIELPGHSCVDGAMCDFFDRGKVDVLVSNCYEDAPHLDDGSYIYLQGEDGFDPSRKVILPTVRAHGAAIGDFRRSGYLDIAFGGFQNRELRIFHGSEKGYSLDDCTRIVLGPEKEGYAPRRFYDEGAAEPVSPEEEKRITEFGQVRWLLAADFNGDGWLDLFVSEILGPRCFILWGGPDGFSTERMQTLHTDGVASAAAADLNGDGYLDLLLAQHMSTKKTARYESYVTVYWGGPDGYRENRKMQLPASCANSVTVGDYSGSGSLDIYATSYNNGRCRDLLSFLYRGNHGRYSVRDVSYLFNHSGSGCVSGDFNGDGYTDLAVACHKEYGNHNSHSFIFWGGPDGLSDERKTVLPTTGPHGMCTVDPGNIMDRGPRERYTSEVFELPAGARVRSIRWEGECTSTSWVETEVRGGQDIERAEWRAVRPGEDLAPLGLTGKAQYRLALCANCACGTPRVRRVIVTCE